MLTLNLHFKLFGLILILLFNAYADITKKTIDIIGKVPHKRSSFTQGLIIEEGSFFESTGAPDGRISKVYEINSSDGTIIKETSLPQLFLEGLSFLNNNLTILTWRSEIAFQIDKNSFLTKSQMSYKGEGWGLTDDGSVYIMSNGSDTLYLRDLNFNIIGKVPIKLKGEPLSNLNELEFVKGKIYANVWYSDMIYEIDITSGEVVSEIDGAILRAKCLDIDKNDVLNGIAYDEKNDTFYLTGKDWPWIFKVKIK